MTYPHNGNDTRDNRRVDTRNDPRDDRGDNRNPNANQRPPRRKEDLKIPDGYQCLAVCIGHSFGQGSKAPQIGVSLRFVDGDFVGQARTWYGSFSPDAKVRSLQSMRALGFQGDDLLDCRSMYPEHGGRPARVTVEQHEWEGDWSERIAWVNDDGVVMKKPLEGRDLEMFAARMRAELRHAGGGPSQQQPSQGYYGGGTAGGPPPQQQRIGTTAPPPPQQGGFNDALRGRDPSQRDPWDDAPPAEPPTDGRYGGRR